LAQCKNLFPAFSQTLERYRCESTQEKTRLEEKAAAAHEEQLRVAAAAREEQSRKAEEAVRPCIAADLPRMESIIQTARNATSADMSIEHAKEEIEKATSLRLRSDTSLSDIREPVLIFRVQSNCRSKFNLLVNVLADQQRIVKRFGVWAYDSPTGYAGGFHAELGRNYVYERQSALDSKLARQAQEERARKASEPLHKAVIPDSPAGDQCAPGISVSERIRRLTQYGAVRQVSEGDYVANGHRVWESYGRLIDCH
jgi:hypothetical protein